jgi:hypothetical protein
MADIVQLHAPGDFAAGWWLDWADNPDPALGGAVAHAGVAGDMRPLRRNPLPSGRRVDGIADGYAPPPTSVTVNPQGPVQPVARVRYCAPIDFDCNQREGDGLLVAVSAGGIPSPQNASIRLLLSAPLAAVGAHVAGSGRNVMGQGFIARLWVRLDGRATWESSVAVHGVLGPAVLGAPPTAPFVAARARPGFSIREARFALAGDGGTIFDQIAIAPLYGMP